MRYAFRMLWKRPGFTLVAICALALGIGANTSIFSVVNAVLLRPLPYAQPERLVALWQKLGSSSQSGAVGCSAPDYIDYRDQTQTLENVAAFLNWSYNLATPSGTERVAATRVSANMFALVGAAPLRGRTFTTDEDRPGSNQVLVLSYGAWQRRFASDPGVIGKTLILDQQPYQVIGIMPSAFDFPGQGLSGGSPPEFWAPIAFTAAQLGPEGRGDNFNISVIARRKPGVSMEQASAEVDRIARRIHDGYPPDIQKLFTLNAFVRDLHEQVVGNVRTLLIVLLAAVGFVLLIGCANVANLLLARAAERRREIAVRTALGASRFILVRQLLTESVLLGLLGGVAGVIVAAWLTQLLIRLSPGNVPRLAESQLDSSVFLFALVISILTGILFGLAPAWQTSKADVNIALKDGARSANAFRHSRVRSALVVAEVALSLILLAGAGLLVRSFVRLRGVPMGFQPDRVLTMSLALPPAKYQSPVQVQSFYPNLLDRIRTLPSVESAAAGTGLPLIGQWNIVVTPEDEANAGKHSLKTAFFAGVTPDFHRTLGIVLKKGRLFSVADRDPNQPVAIVNEKMAQLYWPNQEVLGKRFKWGPAQSSRTWITIVGVVGDVKQSNLAADVKPGVYLALQQLPPEVVLGGARALILAVRTKAVPERAVSDIRGVLRSVDSEVPLFTVRPMEEVLSAAVAPRRFNMLLLASFAGLALLLACIGIYGVISYSVSQYTREIGIRMALGAGATDVVRLIVGQGMALVAIGLILGTAGALALTRLMSTLLFDVKPTDPFTFVAVAFLLAVVALAASYLPAHRATRIDPMVALRYE